MIIQDYNSKFVKCGCGCSGIEIIKDHNCFCNEINYSMYHFISTFESDQITLFQKIKKRIKFAWNILRKGTYKYNELYFTEKQFKEFENIINDIIDDEF